ncbi:MAG: hypothetical protein KGZ58_00605 [Ignavibacteriales bacterium]|nr:hypothetical protein [Ignavibacteriales bacterium]
MKLSFPQQLIVTLGITILLAWYPLKVWTNERFITSAQIGSVIMTVNALFGYLAIEKSFHKSTNDFFKYVFGGMALRLLFLAIFLLIMIKVFHSDIVALLSTMFFYYLVFTILEIVYIQKKIASQK